MKKLLSVMCASVAAVAVGSSLVACSGGGVGKQELTVWCPEGAITCYEGLRDEFVKQDAYKDVKITFQAKPEGEVETALSTDPAAGADLFFFEAGQIDNMLSKNLLQPIIDKEIVDDVNSRDGDTWVKAVTKNSQLFAFPTTADNGWFMYYDSELITEAQAGKLDDIIAVAKDKGKKIMFDYGNGWYISSFFQGAGCTMDYQTEDDGTKTYVTDVDGDKGKLAAQAIANYLDPANNGKDKNQIIIKPSSDMNSEIPNGFQNKSLVAGFIGTWIQKGGSRTFKLDDYEKFDETDKKFVDENGAKEGDSFKTVEDKDGNKFIASKTDNTKMLERKIGALPANIKAVKCPTFTMNGEQVQMGSFMGGKYCGVNAKKGDKKSRDAAVAFANFLTNQKGQEARYAATQAGPTNKTVADSASVKADQALAALSAQNNAGGYVQLSQSSGFWDAMAAFGNKCAQTDGIASKSADVEKALKDLAAAMRK